MKVTTSPLFPASAEGCTQSQTPASRQSPELVTVTCVVVPSGPAGMASGVMDIVARERSSAVSSSEQALSAQATEKMENVRKQASLFINARSAEELVFVRGTTEGINLVANSWGPENVRAGDNIIISEMEHHANIVPWQMLCARTGAELRVIPLNTDGTLQLDTLPSLFDERTRLLAIAHVSNVLGTENPLPEMIALAHQYGAKVLVDGAQAVMHHAVDVQALDCDFYVFSGHKLYGPTGIGVLYVREELLQDMPPFLTGGEMIERVGRYDAVYAPLPHRFEAGTVNAAGAAALGAAIGYLEGIGWKTLQEREDRLTALALEQMEQIPGIRVLGSRDAGEHCGILTFTVEDVHPHDVASILDADHIAVRAGHHCAQPLMEYLKVPSMVRASISFYNTEEEIRAFTESLSQVRRKMGYGE